MSNTHLPLFCIHPPLPRNHYISPNIQRIRSTISRTAPRTIKDMNESWRYTRQGYPSQTLEKHTSPIPTPHSEEIVVRIKAASLNPIDYKL
jgi:hypothetical protein